MSEKRSKREEELSRISSGKIEIKKVYINSAEIQRLKELKETRISSKEVEDKKMQKQEETTK